MATKEPQQGHSHNIVPTVYMELFPALRQLINKVTEFPVEQAYYRSVPV